MATSTAALIVSICSAAVTLGGVMWQLTLFRLSGARLKVQLVLCYSEDGSRTWSTTGRKRPSFADISFDHMSPFGIEYGRVRVTNIGRTAVSVESISFDISRRAARWYLRRRRQTVQTFQYRPKDAEQEKPQLDLSSPIRLEPGDNVTADLHLWPTLGHPDHGTAGKGIRVRGSAHAVGRRWATRSRRRYAWNLRANTWTVFDDVDVTPELRVYRELWFQNYRKGIGSSIALLMYREINQMLADGATHEDLKDYLESHKADDEIWPVAILAYDVHHAYHHETPALWPDPPAPQQSRLHRILWGPQPPR